MNLWKPQLISEQWGNPYTSFDLLSCCSCSSVQRGWASVKNLPNINFRPALHLAGAPHRISFTGLHLQSSFHLQLQIVGESVGCSESVVLVCSQLRNSPNCPSSSLKDEVCCCCNFYPNVCPHFHSSPCPPSAAAALQGGLCACPHMCVHALVLLSLTSWSFRPSVLEQDT